MNISRKSTNSTSPTGKRILAIDPGFGRCGWAIIKKNITKNNLELSSCDCIETSSKKELTERLKELYDSIIYIIKKYKPNELAIESLFWFKNKKTAMAVSQARGVIIIAAKNQKLDIYEYTPLQVKQAVVGYGRADKRQIQAMIKIHLGGQVVPKQDDTADAIAVGLTHLQTNLKLKT